MSGSLKATNLGKTFPGVVALDNVSLEVPQGRVIALVGANGAGKSTLIKILTGYYDQYDGSIDIDGQPVSILRPADAQAHGIEAVYQEVDTVLIPYLTVAENLLIEQLAERRRAPWLNWRALNQEARAAAQRIGLEVDVQKRVEDLVLHEKQMLVIARALSRHVRYLIFDEPTTSLGLREIAQLFDVIRDLKRQNVGIIYISHRLAEVQEIADDVIVLRNGQRVAEFPAENGLDMAHVAEAMLGAPVDETFPPKGERTPGDIVLEARQLSRRKLLHDIDLTVRQGEILGIAGLVGAGKTELLRALFGADKLDSGTILIDKAGVRLGSPSAAVKHGIFLVPEERRSQGVLVEDSIRKNMTLPFLRQFAFLGTWMNRAREIVHTSQVIDRVGLTPPRPEMLVRQLSGGNQQKVAIGKWFGSQPRVMMFDEATQGIDVKAKREVYELAHRLCDSAAVIYASSDIDEVLGLADRVLVMRDGAVVAELTAEEADRQLVLGYATGATVDAPGGAQVSNGETDRVRQASSQVAG